MTRKEIKLLDIIWSSVVKLKAKNKCEVCGKSGKYVRLNSCHIVGRRYRATRWGTFINGIYDLCGFSGCFNDHNQYDEHGPKENYIRTKIIGQERYDNVRKIAIQTIAKNQDYNVIRQQLAEVEKQCLTKKKPKKK